MEAALPEDGFAKASRWAKFATEVDKIAASGDVETMNALESVQEAADLLAADAGPEAAFEAEGKMLDALDNLADRCKAVGSSALQ